MGPAPSCEYNLEYKSTACAEKTGILANQKKTRCCGLKDFAAIHIVQLSSLPDGAAVKIKT